MCQHIDFSNTLDGAKCNDCGMEISSYQEARNEIENGKNEVVKAPRYCSECGEGMWDGFCVDGGCEYYCSEKCLHKHYTEKEWEEMCEGDSDSYWTEWDEDDIEDEDEEIKKHIKKLKDIKFLSTDIDRIETINFCISILRKIEERGDYYSKQEYESGRQVVIQL